MSVEFANKFLKSAEELLDNDGWYFESFNFMCSFCLQEGDILEKIKHENEAHQSCPIGQLLEFIDFLDSTGAV